MPGLNGFEVCKILQMYEDTRHIPVFAITVLDSKEDIDKINACGVKRYMAKPIDIGKLIKLIKDILR
jgi:two-component system, cell cycle response regulator DivK